MNQHLDSEAIGRWVAGERGAAPGEHLQACAQCRAEVTRLESALHDFGDGLRQWSDSQAHSRLALDVAALSTARPRPSPRWALAACALLLLAVPAYRGYRDRQAAAQARADTQLLEEVTADISRSAPEPLEPLIELVSQSSSGENR